MLGAGLFAANLSTTFQLRKFRMADGATYPIVFQVRTLIISHVGHQHGAPRHAANRR